MATVEQEVVSPIRTVKPELPLSVPSINSEPVELDSTPTSPEKMRARRASRDELLAELGGEEKEKRKQLLLEKKSDPAVLVDIPRTPGADEIEKGQSHSEE
ncbi:hypothetical protein MBLNU13_g04385t1 [Cladosporium sp. NU13]